MQTHAHGSPDSWKNLYENLDLSYSENSNTQGKLFEMMKISFLKEIFPKSPANMLEIGCGTAFVSCYR